MNETCLRITFILMCSISIKFVISSSMASNNLKIPLKGIGNSLYVISVKLGTPPQIFPNFAYDITSYYSYVNGVNCYSCKGNLYDKLNSSSFVTNGTIVRTENALGMIKGEIYHDTIKLGNITTNYNNLILSEEVTFPDSKYKYDGVIGIGLDYQKFGLTLNNSVFDKLLEKLSFSNRVFSQKIVNESYGELLIGQVPDEINEAKLNYGKCNLLKDDLHWGCEVTHLAFGDNHTSIDTTISLESYLLNKAYFSTLYSNIIIPEIYLSLFIKSYFKKQIGKTCFVKEKVEDKRLITIYCENYILQKFRNIHLVFDNVSYKIPLNDLFSKKNERFMIFNILFHKSIKAWYLGQIFLKNFIVVFDSNNKQIGFYGNDIINYNLNTRYIWFIFWFVLLIVALLTICFYKILLKGSHKENTNPFLIQNTIIKF